MTGTVILTITGLVSRFIGFFYRIFLSSVFGAEGMGLYQLISPVLALSFSLTVSGIQTAISKYVASETSTRDYKNSFRTLWAGFLLAMALSAVCALGIYVYAEPIAGNLLLEARTAPLLRIIALSIPMASVHSCINGYFYGIKKAGLPAAAQLVEQVVRVASVYIVSGYCFSIGREPAIGVAVLGLTIGEFFSMLVSIASILLCRGDTASSLHITQPAAVYRPLLQMALPLTANRIVLNLLQSVESVSIPARLRMFGYDNATALSVYGVLTGMAMPLIFFPNALTNSVSVMLLPIISESYALGDLAKVRSAALRTVKYCGMLGTACMLGFLLLGGWMGNFLFDSALAGHFITTLGFICPFLYLDTTLSSILQGLGMAAHIFVMNVLSLLIRLGFVFWAVPVHGITGYLWGILASQLTQTILYLLCLRRFLRKAK